jgi:hypothetical protein
MLKWSEDRVMAKLSCGTGQAGALVRRLLGGARATHVIDDDEYHEMDDLGEQPHCFRTRHRLANLVWRRRTAE